MHLLFINSVVSVDLILVPTEYYNDITNYNCNDLYFVSFKEGQLMFSIFMNKRLAKKFINILRLVHR